MFVIAILAVVLILLPGPLILRRVSEKLRIELTLTELALTGFVVWLYIVVILTLFASYFPPAGYYVFPILSALGLFTVVRTAITHRHSLMRTTLNILREIRYFGILIPIVATLAVLTFFHSIYYEYDAYFYYLPIAKALTATGGLLSNPWNPSHLTLTFPPALPILYGWMSWIDPSSFLESLPFILVLMTSIAIYLLAKEAFDKQRALAASMIFLGLPITLAMLSSFSLYLDIAFTFLLVTTLWAAVKVFRNPSPFWLAFLGMSSCLLLLTKELAPFVLPGILAPFFAYRKRFASLLSSVVFASPFLLILLWDQLTSPISGFPLKAYPVVLAMFLVGLPLLRLQKHIRPHSIFSPKYLVILLFGLLPFALFTSLNLVFDGVISASFGPAYLPTWHLQSLVVPATASGSILNEFAWYLPVVSVLLGGFFLVPLGASLTRFARIFSRKTGPNFVFIMLWFTVLATIVMVSFLFQWDLAGPSLRRLLYFAPFICILAADGFFLIIERIRQSYAVTINWKFSVALLVLGTWTYFLVSVIGAVSVNEFPPRIYSVATSGLDILFGADLLILILLVPVTLRRAGSFNLPRLGNASFRLYAIVTLLFMLACSMAVANTWASALQNPSGSSTFQWNGYQNGIANVIQYYQTHIRDSYTTVTFDGWALSYFGNRSVIELSFATGLTTLAPILQTNDTDAMFQFFGTNNIRYFLLPRPGNSQYGLFQRMQTTFPLFSLVQNSPKFQRLQSFRYFELYEFLSNYRTARNPLFTGSFNSSSLGTAWNVESGNWSTYSGTLFQSALVNQESRMFLNDSTFSNCTITLKASFLGTSEGRIGILFRAGDNATSGYTLTITPTVIDLKVGQSLLGPLIANYVGPVIPTDHFQNVEIETYGTHISILLNETVIIDILDQQSLSGRIGLSTYEQEAAFADFSVYADSLVVDPDSVLTHSPNVAINSLPAFSPALYLAAFLCPLFLAALSSTWIVNGTINRIKSFRKTR